MGHTISLLPHGRSHRLLAVPRPLLPLSAAAGHRLPTSRCGAHLLGPTAAGDHPGAGARGHAQQSARQRGRRCQAGPVHQPCCQPDGRATPEQPHGLLQLWPPAPVQAAERRQCRGPQVSLPELGLLEPLSVACGVQEGCLPGLGLFHPLQKEVVWGESETSAQEKAPSPSLSTQLRVFPSAGQSSKCPPHRHSLACIVA